MPDTLVPMMSLDALAEYLHCLETVDRNDFQRRARILQALWREEHGYPIGELRGKPRGAMLAMPWGREAMANFLTDEVRGVVRETLAASKGVRGQLIQPRRMYANLLSSQPMAFNLFSPLKLDRDLATQVLRAYTDGRIHEVEAIDFEFSPGRGDVRYTGDHSAFDVYVRFLDRQGRAGFVGIELKYHENLGEAAEHRSRYDEVADRMSCFPPERRSRLREKPLQQIWRDHLLAGAHRDVDSFHDGFFAYMSPEGNSACNVAIAAYRECLADTDTFAVWPLESFADTIAGLTSARWTREFRDRYLAFGKVEKAMLSVAGD